MTDKTRDHVSGGSSDGNGAGGQKFQLRRIKEFRAQESLLRTMYLESKGFQTIFSYGMAGANTFVLIQALVYAMDRPRLQQDLDFLHWSFVQTFPAFCKAWLQIMLLTCLIHPLERLRSSGFLPAPLFNLVFLGYCCLTTWIAITPHMSGALCAAIASEHTRLIMKTLAFVITKSKQNPDPSQKSEKTAFSHFLYFLFVPTNVFRESYPRSESTNWPRVLMLSYFFLMQVFFLLIAVRHWIAPVFQEVGLRPLNLKSLIAFQATAYGLSFIFHQCGMGIALIHCWMNIFAEILCFGDRNFYQDWWTATSTPDRLRKWNSVVGDWIYEYVYSYLVAVTRGHKTLSTITVFFLSAVLHDYVINMMFSTRFLPIVTVTYGGMGTGTLMVYLLFQKLKLDKILGGYILSNGLDHFGTGIAWIVWINFYGIEFYCRKNVPFTETSLAQAFYPRAPACFLTE